MRLTERARQFAAPWHKAPRAWPADIDEDDFRARCMKTIKRLGWKVEPYANGLCFSAAIVPMWMHVACISPREANLLSRPRDLLEQWLASGHRHWLVVTYKTPSGPLSEALMGREIANCNYLDLAETLQMTKSKGGVQNMTAVNS